MKTNQIIEVKISDIKIGDRFRKEMGDLEALAQSIKDGELLQPIGITPDNQLVFGERRLRACRDILGRETMPARIVDVRSVLLGQFEENFLRKEFTVTERIAIVEALRCFNHGGDRRSDQVRKGENDTLTLDDACARAGFSKDSFYRAKEVEQKGVPELVAAMDEGKLSIHAAQTLAQASSEDQRTCMVKVDEHKATAKAVARLTRQVELDRRQASQQHRSQFSTGTASTEAVQIWCGDCLPSMRDRMEPKTVDVTVTSVPYNIGVEYDSYADNRPEAEYLAWLAEVFAAIKSVLRDDGSFFLNVGGTRRQPWKAMRVAEIASRHFVLQNEIVWVKAISVSGRSHGNFKPINGDRYLNQNWEHVFHFTKHGKVALDRLGVGVPYEDKNNLRRNRAEQDLRCGGDVWFIPHETIRDRSDKDFHPCVFPVELAERCIRLHGLKEEMVVLDPFNGVGNSTSAASRLGVRGIGIDVSPAYCEAAQRRLIVGHDAVVLPMATAESLAMNSVVHGDCREVAPRLPDKSIAIGIMSPPYAQQRKGQYPGVPERDYPDFTVEWMAKLWPKLTDDGSVLIVIEPHVEKGVLADYVLRTQIALRDAGWQQHMPLMWLKGDRCPLGHTGWLRHAYEQILWFSKSAKPFCDPKAGGEETEVEAPRYRHSRWSPGGKSARGIKRASDVIDIPVGLTPKGVDHPAMFPIELAEHLIRHFCPPGGTVWDGFAGSGNSLLAAARLGQPFFGCDIKAEYVELARRRLTEAGSMPKAG